MLTMPSRKTHAERERERERERGHKTKGYMNLRDIGRRDEPSKNIYQVNILSAWVINDCPMNN
jgi:hypothetical protein